MRPSLIRRFAMTASVCVIAVSSPALAQVSEQESLVQAATQTYENFRTDATISNDFLPMARNAKALLILPKLVKAGFILGGQGGSGVLVVRQDSGEWSHPAFFTMTGASIGFQAGVQESQTIFVIRSEQALTKLMKDKVKIGADVGVAVAKMGGGLEGSTTTNVGADIVAFAKSQGLYGGLTLEGAVLSADEEANAAYYGKSINTAQIIGENGAPASPARRATAELRGALPGN